MASTTSPRHALADTLRSVASTVFASHINERPINRSADAKLSTPFDVNYEITLEQAQALEAAAGLISHGARREWAASDLLLMEKDLRRMAEGHPRRGEILLACAKLLEAHVAVEAVEPPRDVCSGPPECVLPHVGSPGAFKHLKPMPSG